MFNTKLKKDLKDVVERVNKIGAMVEPRVEYSWNDPDKYIPDVSLRITHLERLLKKQQQLLNEVIDFVYSKDQD